MMQGDEGGTGLDLEGLHEELRQIKETVEAVRVRPAHLHAAA